MAIRTRSVPNRQRTDHTVESVASVAVQDPRLRPHHHLIFVDCEENVTFEFYLGHDDNFTLAAMYRNGQLIPEVHADQGWARNAALEVGETLTLQFIDPILPHDIWNIQRIEVSIDR